MNTEETNKQELPVEELSVTETTIDTSKISTESRGEALLEIHPHEGYTHDDASTVRRACAYMIDVIEKHREEHGHLGTLTANRELLLNNAITQILNTQLAVVKAIKFSNNGSH